MGQVASTGLRELTAAEIEHVSGARDGRYSYETCVLTWSGIGTFMGFVLGAGGGATIGGILGTAYGAKVCSK